MNRTYDVKSFARMRERTHAFDQADQRWASINTWACGAVTVTLAAIASVFNEAAICTLLAGAFCLVMALFVKPWYEAKVKRKLNADLPPLDLDS